MARWIVTMVVTVWWLGFWNPARVAAQEGFDPLAAARGRVTAELAASLPGTLPEGAVAILPPVVTDPELVDPRVSRGWATALGEALHEARPALRQVDRAHLNEILREQKLGDSAFADPGTAVRVGKLAAARMLLLTRLHEFREDGGTIKVRLEGVLVDVATGENLWSRAYTRGIFPFWATVVLGAAGLVLAAVAWGVWRHRRLKRLVGRTLPRRKSELRVDVDGLTRAVAAAREQLHHGGAGEGAQAVQRAWLELDPVLDRVRHALPGGAVDRSRIRDVKGGLEAARKVQELVSTMRRECELAPTTDEGGRELAALLREKSAALRGALDEFRRHMV